MSDFWDYNGDGKVDMWDDIDWDRDRKRQNGTPSVFSPGWFRTPKIDDPFVKAFKWVIYTALGILSIIYIVCH